MKYRVYCAACGKEHTMTVGERICCECKAFVKLIDASYPYHLQALTEDGILGWKERPDD